MDVHTPEKRSFNMRRIRSKNTKPEMLVRSLVHGLGYRYRLHQKDLPGKPDLVFSSRQKIIFVHGCFWHMHECRLGTVKPTTNATFWENKRSLNVIRDEKNRIALEQRGWKILIIWECQTKADTIYLTELIQTFLS